MACTAIQWVQVADLFNVGLYHGSSAKPQGIPERFITGLRDSKEISSEIESFVHAIYDDSDAELKKGAI
jgi:hypothetical protein